MARGGYRSGAGRPKGAKGQKTKIVLEPVTGVPLDVVRAAVGGGMTPLEYMLKVMNNPEADQVRRDRMAQAAAPYCHGKAADKVVGKKEVQAEEAQAAARDGDWSGDLEFDRPN